MRSDRRPAHLDTERVSVGDAARILGVHPDTLRQDRSRAYPPPSRVGPAGHRRYAIADLRAYLARDGKS